MAALDHPLKDDIEWVRGVVRGVDPSVQEGVKWNAPSYRTADYFATFHLRSRDSVKMVLHRGARSVSGTVRMEIEDPEGLLEWPDTDRCVVTLGAGKELRARRRALEAILRAWIRQL
jgi:hypothetical protein